MALAISAVGAATVDGNPNPNIEITVSGLTGAAFYRITREYDGLPVRGADYVPVVLDSVVVNDWEILLGMSSAYTVVTYNSSGAVLLTLGSNSATAPTGSASFPYWIKVAGTPVSLNTLVGDWTDTSFEPTVLGKYKILGRPNPVVFTDVWGARQGSFSLLAVDLPWGSTNGFDVEQYLQTGDVFLFQTEFGPGLEDMWFVVESMERTAYTRPRAGAEMEYTYQIGFQEVDRPPTSGVVTGFGTWGDLKADPGLVTWANVASAHASWLEVLQAYSSS